MDDNKQSSLPPQTPGLVVLLRKLVVTLCILFAVWLALTFGVPRMLTPPPPLEIQTGAPAPYQTDMPPAPSDPGRSEEMEARIAALEEKLAAAGDDGRIEKLEQQIEAQAQALTDMRRHMQSDAQLLAMMTALGQIREALARGESFRPAVDRLKSFTRDEPLAQAPVEALSNLADNGVPTLGKLQADFAAAIPRLLAPGKKSPLQSLITIRKEGEQQQGNDDEAVIARSEAKVQRGDIEAALNELAALSPAAAEKLSDWKTQAQHYIEARQAVRSLELRLQEAPPPPTSAPGRV